MLVESAHMQSTFISVLCFVYVYCTKISWNYYFTTFIVCCCISIIVCAHHISSGIFYGSWWLYSWWRMCGMMSTHGLCWSICSPVACTHWPPAVHIPSVQCLLVPDISAISLTTGLYRCTVLVRDTHAHTHTNTHTSSLVCYRKYYLRLL